MHEILGRVIDVLELVGEVEDLGQRLLDAGDGMVAFALPQLFQRLSLGHHELEQHGPVLLEAVVERVVILLVGDVNAADQIDRERLARRRGDIVADGRLQRQRPVVRVANDADELERFGGFRLGRFLFRVRRFVVGRLRKRKTKDEKRQRGGEAGSTDHGSTSNDYLHVQELDLEDQSFVRPDFRPTARCR